MGHPLGVRLVAGHRVDAADGQLGGVQREAHQCGVGDLEQAGELLLGVHGGEAVVVQGHADARCGGEFPDPVPDVSDDLDAVGVQRRGHPGGPHRTDDELFTSDAGEEVDEGLRRLDDGVVVGGVGRRPERPALLLRRVPRIPERAGDTLHGGPAEEVQEDLRGRRG